MIVLLLFACTAPSGDSGTLSTGTDDSGAVVETGPTAPLLTPLAEAEDLDPDPTIARFALTAAPAEHRILDWRTGEEIVVEGFAYNGQTPGPVLRATLGDTLIVDFDNQLEDPTTIHWHGIDAPYDMDGVTWAKAPIQPGEAFTYEIPLHHAGTFWYHPHHDTAHQVDHGLYGVVVVEDPDEPVADRDLVLVFDDWAAEEEAEEEGEEAHVHGEDGLEGMWTTNGLVRPTLEVEGGTTLRLRALNASNKGYLDLAWPDARRIAGDQGLLDAEDTAEDLVMAPGDRAEWEWSPGTEDASLEDLPYDSHGGAAYGEAQTLLDLVVTAPAPAAELLDWPFAGGAVTEDPDQTDITYVFQGDPDSGLWMINGEIYPDVTVEELPYGASAVIEVRNLSPTNHPFHLHGLRFELLSRDGAPPAARTIEDTIDVGLYERVRLGVVADNAGDWMAHCHILPHAEGGMMTVLRVLPEGAAPAGVAR